MSKTTTKTSSHHYEMTLILNDTNSDHRVTITVDDGELTLSRDDILYPAELQLVLSITVALQHWLKGRYEKISLRDLRIAGDILQHDLPDVKVETR